MKNFTFVIIDDDQKNGLKTRTIAESFPNLRFLASANCYNDGIDCVLEYNPDVVFLEIDPLDKDSDLSLNLINELHRYLTVIPKIIVTTNNENLSINAIKYGVFDYFINPIETKELRKTLFRLDKELHSSNAINQNFNFSNNDQPQAIENTIIENDSEIISDSEVEIETEHIESQQGQQSESFENIDLDENSNDKEVSFLRDENATDKPLIICVKSYGDYRYIEAKDICYLQADNNSTDIHLNSGEMITAFKTLKHFEGVMTYPFVRIHNSYIANIEYISRIHTGNAVCHIKNSTTKLPFSKSYKENVDAIITSIASGNYLEI